MQKDNIFSVKLVKKNGKLTHQNAADLQMYRNFVDSLEEGQIVETFFEPELCRYQKVMLNHLRIVLQKRYS